MNKVKNVTVSPQTLIYEAELKSLDLQLRGLLKNSDVGRMLEFIDKTYEIAFNNLVLTYLQKDGWRRINRW